MTGWVVEHRRGPAADLHGADLPDPLDRRVWVLAPDRPAVVLGSTQRALLPTVAAAAPPGVDVVVRRSGGGAVLVAPGACTWVDVLLPRGDPWWVDDVGRSARWLGWTWVAALAGLGVDGVVHTGALVGGDLGALACFAGVGPGEVVVGGPSAETGTTPPKLVGIAQRRTRAGARFQCMVLHRHDPAELVGLLGPAVHAARRGPLREALAQRVAVVPVDGDDLVAALVRALGAGTA